MKTQRCDVYGSEEGYRERVMLLYDGIHYDALALAGASPLGLLPGHACFWDTACWKPSVSTLPEYTSGL